MAYDVARVRSCFPALREGAAHFDGPGGSQVPDVVADAVRDTLLSAIANRGSVTAAERRAEEVVRTARRTMAEFLNAGSIVFGRSMTQLTYDLSRTLAKNWRPGDEIVVTRMDHDANIRPWVQAAEQARATVRWAPFDRATGELPVEAVTNLLSDRTRVVAITAASNLLGTKPNVQAIANAAHEMAAFVFVDGVHYTPHVPVDVEALDADFFVCSPYKFLGPHLGVLAAAPELLETLRPDKLLPSTNTVPERFELGTLPYELLAGTTAAVEFMRTLDGLEEHELKLRDQLENGLLELGARIYSKAADRTPTVLFSVDGLEPSEVYRRLGAEGVNAPAGHFYALECSRWLGLGDKGAVRAGIGPYNDESDVDRLLRAVARLR
ncbi:cysteine desulfurase-like protein [Nocardia sp. NRRL S-836]|uniref:cysteine desulfurase-like protein n=1 Tax=Nocardia sp. NRRL S-836 TaxID=1519492 RepID=UPI0006AD943D|nr:cysteine desulfurase-like protein [Nocardia sp. NRRL S-836]KOV82073.1 cysteine desulfurase [Nocardia sp. NRRL S-836]